MRRLWLRPPPAAHALTSPRSTGGRGFYSTTSTLRRPEDIRQVLPRGAYYDILLTHPPPYDNTKREAPPTSARPTTTAATATTATTATTTTTATSIKPAEQDPASVNETPLTAAQQRARIVFGSRLAGPAERAERLAALRKKSKRIAGVLVPPKPDEPDNCCMSGCVNCVWDRFRDEMEAWASANAEATQRLRAQEGGVAAGMSGPSAPPTASPASEPSPETKSAADDAWNEELYKRLPVGIREFMKTEKRLKLRHEREGTVGG
ncbi:Oxidoreductase-lik [Niveomyces insectorum RCEF 264]|uniref:Oxidoreductase-lik n=1 Tax=Niveomyces insectorum RCEF 264 TaxID=1081102 RepID=A0A167RBL2_9HYPO|nr:Oxidoreductase-lik [Niveomyces insectorum RCEF 264]